MIMKNMKKYFYTFIAPIIPGLLLFIFQFCSSAQQLITNTSHLDHLYQEILIDGKTLGIIHIYSEYPDFNWVGDDDEGIACVDDAARAAILYSKHFSLTNSSASLHKVKTLTEFLLYMQSENGWFYNFIWEDYSINKTFQTSVAIPNWWTWRALWALTEIYPLLKEHDSQLAERMLNAVDKTIKECEKEFSGDRATAIIDGFLRPQWLPFETASDQAAILVLALVNYFNITNEKEVLPLIEKLCDGILLMQEGDESNFPYGAFLSWQNIWHAYGNSQSYALLKAYELLEKDEYKKAALLEINNFFEYLISQMYLNEFKLTKELNITLTAESKIFPQIAYGIRPMIYASLAAYELEDDKKYLDKALRIAEWFFGKNYPKVKMYNPANGRCFDGIISIDEINRNSGAESTIEALLSLIELEKYPDSKEQLIALTN
jgi:hypothetical protein